MRPGDPLWWKHGWKGNETELPAVFERRKKRCVVVRTPHDGRVHDVRTSRLRPASRCSGSWDARVDELRAAELLMDERHRLLSMGVPLAALVREIEQHAPSTVRKRTVEIVLAAARRLEKIVPEK